jgi:hypothetical protein
MLNEGALRVADVVIEISILDKERSENHDGQPAPIVRPFRISAHATIEAGYTVNYQMLLRNLSPECPCVATVKILSARPD